MKTEMEPKAITMKGKWKAVPHTPKGCRNPRYLIGIRLNNNTYVCLQPVGDVYGGPIVFKEDAEWWAEVLNKGRAMNKLTPEQYADARRMIQEEVVGAYRSHKGKILEGWYDKLADVLQFKVRGK